MTMMPSTVQSLISLLLVPCAAHSNLIYPKPRNAIDSLLPEWSGGKAPYVWEPYGEAPCACTNGTEACESAQTCLWFSVGTTIGCDSPDGGLHGNANPNVKDRCGSGMKATINEPRLRTINRDAVAGSEEDWTKFNPWRAPGSAPVYDPCGRASGGPHATPGHGEFTNTTFARIGDLGSRLPKLPSGAVWKVGATVETMWSLRTNHGGGYQYRLCPLQAELTEECFQATPVPFAGDSKLMLGNGTRITLNSTFVSEGTRPAGSTWQRNPIPGYVVYDHHGGWDSRLKRWFDPPCDDPASLKPARLGQGLCSGEWLTKVTTYDQLRIPDHLEPGEYVLGFRWDCESSAQVWQSCADVTITA
mmetsp:Transcript_25457/g.51703  ORF Transcript_25457/g.51703 Transcript_25457/m.51703 type:complete len:360 (-) Transcript_25457:192-1271(-)